MIGVRGDGTKEVVALADGYRESADSWADLLPGDHVQGMIQRRHRCPPGLVARLYGEQDNPR